MKQLTIYIFLLLVSYCQAQNQDASSSGKNSNNIAEKIKNADANLCEILKSPEAFEGKLLKVKAVYRYGFEWSELYTLKCQTNKRIWVETTDKKCENSSEIEDLPFAGAGSRTAGIVAIGKFSFKDVGYGHMNSFDYKFTIDCFEKAKLIDNDGFVPKALTPKQRQKIEEFENSK